MTRLTFFINTFLVCLSLTGCKSQSKDASVSIVTVSILPQKYIVEQIAGNKFQVQLMLPPGANHETFEPTPRDMEKMSGAKIYFTIGPLDFEQNWLPRFTAAQPVLKVVNTSRGIQLIEGHQHESDQHDGRGIDPHTWLSPKAVKIQAATICNAFISIDSANSVFYRKNQARFYKVADSVDNYIRKKLECCPGKAIMLFHPALAYFARDYNLQQISIEDEGKEPSPSHLRELIDLARIKKIRVIYISKEFDVRHAEAIAGEIGAKVVVFDPMSANWPANMMHLADLIAEN